MIEIRLSGAIPSKKNQRINTKSGRSFASKEFTDWQTDALWQVRQQTRTRFLVPVSVDIICLFGRKTVSDLDNRLSSIMDMLKESLIIRDDKWEFVPSMSVRAHYQKGIENGAILRIREINMEQFTKELIAQPAPDVCLYCGYSAA